jgi:hypothetical protein
MRLPHEGARADVRLGVEARGERGLVKGEQIGVDGSGNEPDEQETGRAAGQGQSEIVALLASIVV